MYILNPWSAFYRDDFTFRGITFDRLAAERKNYFHTARVSVRTGVAVKVELHGISGQAGVGEELPSHSHDAHPQLRVQWSGQ
jgi:hypothetical protein